jgi:hypothetical protein
MLSRYFFRKLSKEGNYSAERCKSIKILSVISTKVVLDLAIPDRTYTFNASAILTEHPREKKAVPIK